MAFPCGLQQAEAWSRRLPLTVRSEDVNVTMETEWDRNATFSWEDELSQTESSGNLTTVNASSDRTGNWTELWGGAGDRADPRIVGGNLERPGGSPWQVAEPREPSRVWANCDANANVGSGSDPVFMSRF